VISLKQKRNIPTTVEPSTEQQRFREKFVTVLQVDKVLCPGRNGVYMTSYSRLRRKQTLGTEGRKKMVVSDPMDLIKASNGASDLETNSDNH
jgi:hypothetical protein